MIIDPLSSPSSRTTTASEATGKVRGAAGLQPASESSREPDFAALLGEAISDVAGQLRKAEAVSISGIKGMASTQEVVEQVMAAEQTLQASIAIRDKIVAAYLEISRMTI
jgi:flagellar hook-basal body complex protein FliE